MRQPRWELLLLILFVSACGQGGKSNWTMKQSDSDKTTSVDKDKRDAHEEEEFPDPDGPGSETKQDAELSLDGGVSDAAVDAAPDATPMLPGCVKPLTPTNANDESADTDNACATKDARVVDGKPAGLDLAKDGKLITFDNHQVAGCLKVDFGEVRALERVIIYRRAVPSACSTGVTCEPGLCGSGHYMDVFRGTKDNDYTFVAQFTVGDSVNFGRQFVEIQAEARFIVVCRPAVEATRGDIQVDGVVGCLK